MQETQNGLKLLGGRVNSLECVYKGKSGFDYSFSLDGQIVWLARHLSDFGYLVIMFAFIICLFLSLPLLCLDGKTRTDKANAYLALRKFLKEADL